MMKGSWIVAGVLGAALIGSGYYGYTQHQQLNEMNLKAENNYQRAFNELTFDMDLLHDKIGTTLAMNSRSSLSPALADVWRISIQSKSDIAQLPLKFVPFDKTQAFLTGVGNFSYKTAVRDLNKEPLTDKEFTSLKNMYSTAEKVQDGLRNVQTNIMNKNLSWIDVGQMSEERKGPRDNSIVDGFKHIEQVKATTDQDFGPTFTNGQEASKGLRKLTGKKIDKNEAEKIAQDFVPLKNVSKIQVTRSNGNKFEPFYAVTMNHSNPTADTYMQITQTAGLPIFFMTNRPISKQQISLDDAVKKGLTYLNSKNYKNMELYDSTQYDAVGVLQYVKSVDNVRIYPEALQLKVALDNGQIIGFNAKNYITSNHVRKIPTPKLTLEQARAKLNKNVKVEEERLAIILSDFNKEILTYEFLGTYNHDTYDIYINAMNGNEEKVKKL
ncbi:MULTISPECIES: germination protein YpeB [unclassified Bacillus (in: firmicutes)]|uniref:germination protein YpeB n=1 Tax=unclassified Bacillus (in: firmicutes) TaxID=185979 RepID=UPI000BEF8599|nr:MULTISPECIES: germination protein YpeB [unclassified Bacillus (in: firmicutes)]PEJ59139.1 germination protein YpeB [Bacillus sp. AFS002410]PEL14356.1 germination protein YpeB [Bacillus sp. AFS017336]